MNKKDISFLVELNERLNGPETTESFTPNMSGSKISFKVRYSNEKEKLNGKEMKQIMNILENDDDARFYPIQSNFGFCPSYIVGKKDEMILKFSDRQLPEKYDFDKLAEHFNLKDTGISLHKKSSYYY